MMTDDLILDADSVADILKCTRQSAEDLMRKGELPATKIGRGWITTRAVVLNWLRCRIEVENQQPRIASEPIKRRGRPRAPIPSLG